MFSCKQSRVTFRYAHRLHANQQSRITLTQRSDWLTTSQLLRIHV